MQQTACYEMWSVMQYVQYEGNFREITILLGTRPRIKRQKIRVKFKIS